MTRLRGGPIGGICCVANAPYASAIKCGWLAIIFFQPNVSVTSVGCLSNNGLKSGATIRIESESKSVAKHAQAMFMYALAKQVDSDEIFTC